VKQESLLGLQKLAAEKRAAAEASGSGSSKRSRTEIAEDENGMSISGGVFKGRQHANSEPS
jgi:hypothetical protein